jgi:hypothetical protein
MGFPLTASSYSYGHHTGLGLPLWPDILTISRGNRESRTQGAKPLNILSAARAAELYKLCEKMT